MKRLIRGLLGCGLLVVTSVPVLGDEVVRRWDRDLAVDGAAEMVLDLPVAELEIEGSDGDSIRLTMKAECSRQSSVCREIAEDLEVETRVRGDRLLIELDGWPRIGRKAPELTLRVLVPRHLDVAVDLGVGEVSIEGIEASVDVDAGVGEVTVHTRESIVRNVSLDTGVGEVSLRPRQPKAVESGFIGHDLRWSDGSGLHSIHVDVGVGEVDVFLEERVAYRR